jgi:lipopolysaccharide transport system permease protein
VRAAAGIRVFDLVWTLVRTDFKARYHGTAAGFLWAVLKPAAMFLVLVGVFSLVFASQRDYGLNLVVGLFLWDFFAETTKVGITSLHAKAFLITRAPFPRWIVVAASSSNALVTLAVFFGSVLVYLTLAGRPPAPWAIALFGFYLLELWLIVLGFSLAASVLFLRFRDLNQVWEVASQAGFFVAPIIYPLAILPERLHFWLYLWPPTPVIQFSRFVLVEGEAPTARGHLYLALLTLVILGAGIAVYRRLCPRAVEEL